MSELIEAAKAVINYEHDTNYCFVDRVSELRAAVEEFERQEAVGFNEWLSTQKYTYQADDWLEINFGKSAWTAAQQAERARIRDIIKAVGVQGEHDKWFECADAIMEKIDATE